MADVVDKATRSRMMSGIRSQNTRPEIELRTALHTLGLRYRLHVRDLPGRPDIVFPRYRAVVQVHGCFWHRHKGCKFTTTPTTNDAFWSAKFEKNIRRDLETRDLLDRSGWRTAVVWECSIRAEGGRTLAPILQKWLEGQEPRLDI